MITDDEADRLTHSFTESRSKYEALNFAKQALSDDDYRWLEQTLERGFQQMTQQRPHSFSKPYKSWCEAFKQPCVLVDLQRNIYIILFVKPSSSQARTLSTWGWEIDGPTNIITLHMDPYSRRVGDGVDQITQEAIEEALHVLQIPFVQGLLSPPTGPSPFPSPIKSRWERLMGEDPFSV